MTILLKKTALVTMLAVSREDKKMSSFNDNLRIQKFGFKSWLFIK